MTAITVQVDDQETQALADEWRTREIPVELKIINSPYREITTPILDYIRDIHRDSPRDAICVFIPEYVVSHWWERALHNQSALRLKARLFFTPGVMVCSVAQGVSDEWCKWPNTLSCGLAGRVANDRNTGGRESTIIGLLLWALYALITTTFGLFG